MINLNVIVLASIQKKIPMHDSYLASTESYFTLTLSLLCAASNFEIIIFTYF